MNIALQSFIACFLILALCIVAPANAQGNGQSGAYSFALQNQSPLAIIYGLPRYQEANITPQGESQWDFSFDVSNSFTARINEHEMIRLDGENNRLGLRYLRGTTNGWEYGIELPLIHHGGGKLDNLVEEFHDLFGFNQRGRERVAQNLLIYQYERNGVRQFSVDQPSTGVGDVSLLIAKQLGSNPGAQTSLRAQLKLPTGDSARLMGSGAWDTSLGIYHSASPKQNWHWQAHGGVSYLGTGDLLPEQQNHWVFNAGVGLNWQAFSRLGLRVQFDAHTALYSQSNLNQLNQTAFILSAGGRISLNKYGYLDLAITENAPNPETTPDVGFHINWRLPINNTSSK
ncbi:MAG: DUF3187 family protein [Proteobacteria bacterium]|jgi:hypothetical protein|nr:DUF3187 family protein [Pseudomonadota bacterium]